MIYYKNNYGQTVYLDRWPYKMLTDTDLFDYEWSYKTQNELNPKISRFYRNMVQRKVGIVIGVKKDEDYATELIEAFEKDVVGVTPGKLYVNDSYVSCYFIKGEKTKWKAGQPFPMVTFTLICEKGSWITESSTTFRPGTTPPDTNSVSGTFLNILDAINSTMYLTSWTKNLLTTMTLANLKTENTSGTWTDYTGYSTYLRSGITFTITHSNGNVIGMSVSGTSTALVTFYIGKTGGGTLLPAGQYTASCRTKYTSGLGFELYSYISSYTYAGTVGDSGIVVNADGNKRYSFAVTVDSGATIASTPIVPQIEAGSVKHNFVPPSGYSIYATQKNILPQSFSALVNGTPGTWTTVSSTVSTLLKNGVTFTITHNGDNITGYSLNGTCTGAIYLIFNTQFTLGKGTYTCTDSSIKIETTGTKVDGTNVTLCAQADLQKTSTYASDVTFTRWFMTVVNGSVFSNESIYPQLEVGSTVTTYEAYNGNTVNLTNDTTSPVPMTSYSGVTNVFSGYGGMLNLTYPREIPVYLDYPYDYSFDYMALDQSQNITNGSYAAAHFEMLVYGACTNPSVIIGGHEYEVDCVLATGEYLVINTLDKKVYKVNLDGTKESQLNNRNRDSYLFEKLPSGSNTVQWNGLFGFDVNMLMERSEPIWI